MSHLDSKEQAIQAVLQHLLYTKADGSEILHFMCELDAEVGKLYTKVQQHNHIKKGLYGKPFDEFCLDADKVFLGMEAVYRNSKKVNAGQDETRPAGV